MRLIGYARRAGPDSRDGNHSLQAQIDRLRDWSRANGHDLVAIMHEDAPGVSAAARPVLRALLRSVVKDNTVDGLLVTRVNRLARNELDAHVIRRALDKVGKRILACDDQIDTGIPAKDVHFGIMVTTAACEYRDNVHKLSAEIYRARIGHREPGLRDEYM